MKQEIKKIVEKLKGQDKNIIEKAKKRKIITISRTIGSGGDEIAKIIADRLNFKLYSRELIMELAEFTGTDKEAFSVIADITGDSKDFWLYKIFGGDEQSHDTINRHSTNVIQALASIEDCVIIGRGAHVALHDTANIRVRISAPQDICIQNIMTKEKCNIEAATTIYNEANSASGKYVWNIFNSRLNDPANFDIVINTEKNNDYNIYADIIINTMNTLK